MDMNLALKQSQSQEYCDKKDQKDRIKHFFEKIVISDGPVYEGEEMNGRRQRKGRLDEEV
jgi:hypothetical protein